MGRVLLECHLLSPVFHMAASQCSITANITLSFELEECILAFFSSLSGGVVPLVKAAIFGRGGA